MFAVPGWSVSKDNLKSETAPSGVNAPKSRKRKRNNGNREEIHNVTPANVADLYELVVEGKPKPQADGVRAKSTGAKHERVAEKKKQRQQQQEDKKDSNQTARSGEGGTIDERPAKKKKKTKTKTQETDVGTDGQSAQPDVTAKKGGHDAATKPEQTTASRPAAAAVKLTPLQASMREKLVSARFRHLNETLYTRPSGEAFGLFQESPEMFDEYHEGFRRQVKVWPENPVDSFLSDIRSRAKIRTGPVSSHGKPSSSRSRQQQQQQQQQNSRPLPRTMGTCTIADLGCGDARLAQSLQKDSAKLKVDVKSFDLQSPNPLVTKADIADLPLADGSVNVAIFCLALMGTNWMDFIEEAYRVLHWKGELWIAEIKSRFAPPAKATTTVVDHSVGHRRKTTNNNKNTVAGAAAASSSSKKAKAARDAQEAALHGEHLAVEVDGLEDRRRETDVSAFVAALARRGFVLQGEKAEAVDLSNRMFVKIHFIKGAAPTKGKGVKAEDVARAAMHKKKTVFAQTRDQEDADDKADINEAAILKPCVYKLR
ncbi:Methyltransferase-related protein [Moelleriella libera RCEF 2490]|uniref:Ribosomal RNA-processing protein 8 n=1 Tax=Moelleriella libera RCEF 2490 TaxID=1081109 RepID=A0A166UAP9_9HYPO|nr:Methyltransferase-related protein [Moelleriella libera RCEF 2490]